MGSRIRISVRSVLQWAFALGCLLVVLWEPVVRPALNGHPEALWSPYLIVFGPIVLLLVGSAVLGILRRRPARQRINTGATDRTFRVSLVTPRLVLGLGLFLGLVIGAFASPIWVPLLWPGTEVRSEGDPITALLFIGGFFAFIVFLMVVRKAAWPPVPVLSPGPATLATGGRWHVGDPSQLIAAPNGSARIHVAFIPASDFEATAIRATVKAVEYWVASQDEEARRRGIRSNGIVTVVELPIALNGPSSYRTGQAVEWDVAFDLDGQAPPTCGDTEHLGCRWTLAIAIDGLRGGAAEFEQPILVTQPRARVNSGAMEMAQFSRFEQASGSSGPIRVDFRVTPAPLDLAAPAVAEVIIANGGPPIACKEVRLEIWANAKVTVQPAFTMEQILWSDERKGPPLPAGESSIRFQIPAINRAWPDADLLHGWMRGGMKLIVALPSRRDLCVVRDLCLCLDKPRPAPVGQPATATTP